MSNPSRRKLITTALAATAGASGLAAAARFAGKHGLLPPDCGGIYGLGTSLTFAAHRLFTGDAYAREFPTSKISKAPFAKVRPFKIAAYDRMRADNFVDWRVEVDGMVARLSSFSVADLKRLPSRTQITQLTCEEGWSYIAEWIGTPVSHLLNAAGILPQARYIVYYSIQKNWIQSIDLHDALHPQTLLTYAMNGADLPMGHGGPVRLSIPRQLGYKNVKYINRLTLTDSIEGLHKIGAYSWYAGI
ncbi:MAG: molybdopterin-dependent oxidoreductase [Acidobacteriota bacterium]